MNITLTPQTLNGYRLLDFGNGQRLEEWGPENKSYRIIRPEMDATNKPYLPIAEWQKAIATFTGKRSELAQGGWSGNTTFSTEVSCGPIKMLARPTPAGHMGVFPENAVHWEFIQKLGTQLKGRRVLNLFGYTGGASLMAATCGAEVTHVDTSKPALTWGRENQKLSGLDAKPIRWMPEDARTFVSRETKRGNTYDGIILDPPLFGHGIKKSENWDLYKDLPELLGTIALVMNPDPLFFILNTYTIPESSAHLAAMVKEIFPNKHLEHGQAGLQCVSNGPRLNASIFCRWSGPSPKT